MQGQATTVITERPQQRGGLVGPTILIGLGVIFLLNNFGLLSWNIWGILLRLWPILLIATGLDILIGRRSALGSLLVVALMVAAIATAVWFSGMLVVGGTLLSGQVISQTLGEASRADVHIGMSTGTLHISALNEPNELISGSVVTGENERVIRDFSVRNGTAYFKLISQQQQVFWYEARDEANKTWNLRLNPNVPLSLRLDGGVGKINADLSPFMLTKLVVDTGVGNVDITLPRSGVLEAKIDGGVGNASIVIPNGMAARIRVDSGLGKVDVNGNYTRQGDIYISPDYASAINRVDLVINAGIGKISVRQGE